jgi:hypothetical protein
MPTYAEFVGWVISTLAGWFVVTADNYSMKTYKSPLFDNDYYPNIIVLHLTFLIV